MSNAMLNDPINYPTMPNYDDRCRQRFTAGSAVMVRIGPAYMGNGRYADDGLEGIYYVLRELPLETTGYVSLGVDYYLSKTPGGSWDVICHTSRLTSP